VSTIVAASRATSVPATPHCDADVGAPQGPGVVDAVTRHRHRLAAAPEEVGDSQLRLRRRPREDELALLGEQAVERGVGHAFDLVRAEDIVVADVEPNAAGDLERCQSVVAGDDQHADSCPVALFAGVGDLGPRRIEQGDQPDQLEPFLDLVPVVAACGQAAPGESEDA
jgi:hypothetical protein